jgi:23S rRNA (uracil1939-C5)-methyltransferase
VESFAGVEYDRMAIRAANRNMQLHGVANGGFVSGSAEEKLPELLAKFTPGATTVILDPPRKGCLPQTVELLRQARPAQVIYVSCHPATMARDLNAFTAGGVFNLKLVKPLDMFPQTQHVECVADLRRNVTT